MQYVLTLEGKSFREDFWTCPGACNVQFENKLREILERSRCVGTDSSIINHDLWGWVCLSVLSEIGPKLVERFIQERGYNTRDGYQIIHYEYVKPLSYGGKYQSTMQNRFYFHAYMLLANNFVVAGRRLEAAQIYDNYHIYDKARELREKEKQIVVKTTDISINLNTLLQQVKDSGIVVVYRCPHCGGKLKIGKDTSGESLRMCEHCGFEIETMDLADFLKTALS